LNTWIYSTGCADNADASCYCAQSNFTTNVIGCIQSWGADSEVQSALSYLAGICANHIKQNPAIITAMPSSITLAPPPAAATPAPSNVAGATQGSAAAPLTTAPAAAVNVPVTTIVIQQTVTVPCTFTNGASSGSAIPSSSTTTVISSVVTVPQVQFITQTAAGNTAVVSLAAGSPSSAPASPTAPAAALGASGGNAPAGYGPTTMASAYASQGNPTATTSSGVVLFTGAASAMSPGIMVSGAVGGLLALLFQL